MVSFLTSESVNSVPSVTNDGSGARDTQDDGQKEHALKMQMIAAEIANDFEADSMQNRKLEKQQHNEAEEGGEIRILAAIKLPY